MELPGANKARCKLKGEGVRPTPLLPKATWTMGQEQGPHLPKLRWEVCMCGEWPPRLLNQSVSPGGYTSRPRDLTERPENGHHHLGVRATQRDRGMAQMVGPPGPGMQNKGAGSPLCCPHLAEMVNIHPFKDPGNGAPPQFVQVKSPRILRISPSRLDAPSLH